MEFKWGEFLEPPAPGFDKPGQTKPSSLYNVRNEQKALVRAMLFGSEADGNGHQEQP